MPTAFPNKATESRIKNMMPPANLLQTDISIWPVGEKSFGVAVKLQGKTMQSKLVASKSEIIALLQKVL